MEIAIKTIVIFSVILLSGLIIITFAYNSVHNTEKKLDFVSKKYKNIIETKDIEATEILEIIDSCRKENKATSKEKLCYIIKSENTIPTLPAPIPDYIIQDSSCSTHSKNMFITFLPGSIINIKCS